MFFICLMSIESDEERKSIEEIYYRYRYQCLYMAKKYTDNDEEAEDMVQETFVRLIRHKEEYLKLSYKDIEALLVTIMKNIGIDIYRKKRRILMASEQYDEYIASNLLPTEAKVMLQEDLKRVLEEIHKYDSDTQLIMYYKCLAIPTKTIAKMMNMPYKTVETKIYRVRRELKDKVKDDDIFE